ncbi:flagellar export protein FliJ [Caloranaerobacter ferrireducens]|uniref:flagellar export protein FliJ n=1 Tax=Caloranaerobacter ferrireducens TaxID=1323370 RepID=UPI00084D3232|nr:flagellar export protein FliJ [Caloranaerobacter ferrireducens]
MQSRFKFKFQKILEYKETMESLKLADYNKAKENLNIEENKLKKLINYQKKELAMRNRNMKNITIFDLKNYNTIMNYINKEIEKQEIRVDNARDIMDSKKKVFLEALKEKKIMEKIKEKHYNEFTYEIKKEEDNLIDEIVNFRNSKN